MPTLYHDLVHHERFKQTDVSSVRKIGFAGASMTDGLLKELQAAFKPELFVNHYGSSEIYTFTIDQNAPSKARLGRPRRHQPDGARGASSARRRPTRSPSPARKARSSRCCRATKSFEGYWRRPEADAKALRQGWYFTGDTGMFDADGDLFVTGRVDDMIITGGENVSPVEIESCLSLHQAVSEVAVVGLPDERWGKVVTAFIKRSAAVEHEQLDQHCRDVGPCQLQAAAALCVRRDDPEIAGRQAVAPAAGGRRIRAGTNRSPLTRNRRMSTAAVFDDPRLAALDGFRVEIDEARERADVILDRPPLNVVSMPQRDQLRLVFESLDENSRVRDHRAARHRRAFLQRRQHQGLPGGARRRPCPSSPGTSRRRRAAPSR